MTSNASYSLRPVGFVRSRLTAREEAPKQGSEGAPEAWVELDRRLIRNPQEYVTLRYRHGDMAGKVTSEKSSPSKISGSGS
jgi:hypothetical protein